MGVFDKLLGLRLVEDLAKSPNWESTWWADTVFRGLQEADSDLGNSNPADHERAGQQEQQHQGMQSVARDMHDTEPEV
jgi:hypothetical protein